MEQITVVNCTTGEVTVRDFTPDELAQRDRDRADATARDAQPQPPDPDAELTAAITAATTLAALKAALLGSRGGRVKARPGE